MKKAFAGLAIFAMILLLNCCSSRDAGESFPYSNYHYRSYNFLGDLVGDGTIYINRVDSNLVTGNWNIREVRLCPNCGRQFGSGYLEGYMQNDTLIINLNPNDIDIDTKLIGVITEDKFSGDWRWIDRQGFGFSGQFTANK